MVSMHMFYFVCIYVFNVKLKCYILKLSITILSLSNTGCSYSAVMRLICNSEVNLGGNLVWFKILHDGTALQIVNCTVLSN